MTTIFGRCFIAGSLLAALAIASNHLHAQAGGRSGAVGGRGAPPATGSRSTSAPPATAVQDRVSEDTEAKYQQMGEQVQQPIPKRDYKVETGEPAKTKLFRADPKLLEKKFVASFSLVTSDDSKSERGFGGAGLSGRDIRQTDWRIATGEISTGYEGRAVGYPADLLRLIRWEGRLLFINSDLSSWNRERVPLSQHHKWLVEKCSAENRPAESMIAFLTSADCDLDIHRVAQVPGARNANSDGWTYHVYASSAEEAEQRVVAILQLLDGGLSRPMREYLLAEGRKSLNAARQVFEEVAKLNADIKAEEDKLAKPSEISPDILSQLKAQKVMVAVELAGLIARVKACDDMLKDPKKLEISTLQSVSDMKVKAEIERVGIKEKLDQINAFIGEGDGRQATQDRIAELKKLRTPVLRRAQLAENAARTYVSLFDLYAPLPLKDNQITISPVEWTN